MSHSKERVEKNCLNCGETVQGRYCQVCGQENIEPKETLWGLVLHFFQDITHFDGKFFSTGKLLLTKPGFLPKEYLKGRRASYLHPIRMYVFTSAVFFLIFYSVFNVRNLGIGNKRTNKEEIASLAEAKERSLKTAKTKDDSIAIERTFRMLDRLPIDIKIDKKDLDEVADDLKEDLTDTPGRSRNNKSNLQIDSSGRKQAASANDSLSSKPSAYRYRPGAPDDSTLSRNDSEVDKPTRPGALSDSTGKKASIVSEKNNDKEDEEEDASPGSRRFGRPANFGIFDVGRSFMSAYNSKAEYDSVQATLPADVRDGWLKRRFALQNIQFKQRYGDDEGALVQDLLDKFVHTFPYLLFISLPLYALFLKLLYIRRKQFFYADHGLFLIYLYIFPVLLYFFFIFNRYITVDMRMPGYKLF